MPDPGGIKAGLISKPYGLQGKVHLILQQGTGITIETGDPLFINMDGQRVPFFVTGIDVVATDQAIVEFEFIDSLEEARKVSGCEVFFDPSRHPDRHIQRPDPEQLVGFRAVDREKGGVGVITGFMPHELNPVLIVEHEEREYMIPVSEDLITRIDPELQIIYFNLPEGLFQV